MAALTPEHVGRHVLERSVGYDLQLHGDEDAYDPELAEEHHHLFLRHQTLIDPPTTGDQPMSQLPNPTDAERRGRGDRLGGRRFVLERLPRGSVGAEIGVHLGDFSQAILDVVRPSHLHLIDPWRYEPAPEYGKAWYGGRAEKGQEEMDDRHAGVLARFAEEIRFGQVSVHRGTSVEVLAGFDDGSLDWVYIDGNHLYEFVAQDLELSMRKTRPGGLVTGDDYTEGGWWEGGVKRAVDELAAAGTARLLELRNRQYVFEKPIDD